MSGEEDDKKSPPNFGPWLTGILGFLVAVTTVLGVFVKITPIEVDSASGLGAVLLFVAFLVCAGATVWSHRHRRDAGPRTALLATVAAVALIGGVLLALGSARGTSGPPAAAGSPTLGTSAPGTTTTTAVPTGASQNDGVETIGAGPTTRAPGGQGGAPNTARATVPEAGPPRPHDVPVPSADAVRYQGEFRLSAAQESVDLDQDPPAAYGPTNELSVDDHRIWTVPPDTSGAAVSGSPTRAQCVDAVDRANPPAEYFDSPRPGDLFCVRTSEGRYALVRVVTAGTKDFTLSLTVWD